MQKKIKTLVRTLCGENGEITLKLSLLSYEDYLRRAPFYSIAAETERHMSVVRIPADLSEASKVLEILFEGGVTPTSLKDIISDMYSDAV